MTTLPLLEVDLGPRVRAAFTRVPFDLSLAGGTDPAAVRSHRRRLEDWAGAPVAYLRQVHGAQVHVLRAPPPSSARPDDDVAQVGVSPQDTSSAQGASVARETVATADAAVTALTSATLAVLVADCVPVVLSDPDAGVVAVIHAGRRGVVAGVVPAALEVMSGLGARVEEVRAAVGPAVCGRCYEVPEALQREVEQAVPGTASTTSWGTPALDLPAAVRHQLSSAGVGRIEHVDACTLTDERWFSHRGAGQPGTQRREGRFAAVVRLLPPGSSGST